VNRPHRTAVTPTLAGLAAATLVLAPPGPASAAQGRLLTTDACRGTSSNLHLNGDGFDDAAVGSPGEDWSGHLDAGIVHLISFTPDGNGGPGSATAVVVDQGDVAGAVETGDQFGYAVALSNYRGSDEPLGAIGARGEDLQVGYTIAFSEASTAATADHAVAVGTPGGDLGAVRDAGAVTLILDLPGSRLNGGRSVSQHTSGFAGRAEAGDRFGHSVALRPGATSSQSLLVIGTPQEDVGSVVDAGTVQTVAVDLGTDTLTPLRSGRFGWSVSGLGSQE
jgi:hypothetical protein